MVDERKTSVDFEVKGQASKSQLDLVKNQIPQKLYFVLSEILQRALHDFWFQCFISSNFLKIFFKGFLIQIL